MNCLQIVSKHMESKATNEDCMALMARYLDKYFVDPPYGIDRNGMTMGNSVFNKDSKAWDKSAPNADYFNELFRVSKNQIIWGGQLLYTAAFAIFRDLG